VTKEGLSPLDLPKNSTQLKELAHRCDQTRAWIGFLDYCALGTSKLDEIFEQDGKNWFLKIGDHKTTLPGTLPTASS
jgi:hypothetical protein